MRFGNPFLVYDLMERDQVQLPSHVNQLVRWLVHWDWEPDRDYTQAWSTAPAPELDGESWDILETLLQREYRNSRCLGPAWELIASSEAPRAVRLRQAFLSEFAALLGGSQDADRAVAESLVSEASYARCPLDPADDGRPFRMGSPDDVGDKDEHPRHPVIVSPFDMLRAPVTNRQFELFDPTHRWLRDEYSPDDDCPVIRVNWHMAWLFCIWLSGGGDRKYRLPTEAEWEYACRAGQDGERDFFHVGDSLTSHQANFDGRFPYPDGGEQGPRRNRTTAAETFEANAWGLFDMHGNVWEWCADWFAEDYYKTLQTASEASGQPAADPPGPALGSSRVLRGGSFYNYSDYCRSARRDPDDPVDRFSFIGFRLLREL